MSDPMDAGEVRSSPRKPWAAALFSVFAPGLGQLYAGLPRRALIAVLLALAAELLVIPLAMMLPGGIQLLLLALDWDTRQCHHSVGRISASSRRHTAICSATIQSLVRLHVSVADLRTRRSPGNLSVHCRSHCEGVPSSEHSDATGTSRGRLHDGAHFSRACSSG